MDDHLKEALDIVKAQASVRIMSEDEIISMVRRLSSDIKNVAEGEGCVEELASSDVQIPNKVINPLQDFIVVYLPQHIEDCSFVVHRVPTSSLV